MVHRWSCNECGHTVWTGSKAAIRRSIHSHLFEHYQSNLYREEFQTGWNCPRCSASEIQHDVDDAVASFKQHLFEHAEDRIQSGTHVASDLSGTGNVLVLSGPDAPGADNARIHFGAPCDIVILVTTNVVDRLRLLDDRFNEWPNRTIAITPTNQPLAGMTDVDLRDVAVEVVKLNTGLALPTLGETISRVVEEHNDPNVRLSVSFSVLSQIVADNDLEQVFRFLHLLTSRLEGAGTLSHFYYNPKTTSGPTVNLLSELFDLRIEAKPDRFVLADTP